MFLSASQERRRHLTKAWSIIFIAASLAANAAAQSTFATMTGSVTDPSGAAVASCIVKITNTGTSATRASLTDATGSYLLVNIEPGVYDVEFQAPGFQVSRKQADLPARAALRVDGALSLSAAAQAVNVTAEAVGVITTESSTIAETKTGRELIDLPVAIASRAAGSTSPITTLTTQPGVQIDSSGNISVAGNKPSMLSVTIDGINTQSAKDNSPVAELFPSFEGIAEIRVSEINNSAEFGGVSNITTISKSGTNFLHGSFFENFQNRDLNAKSEFAAVKPNLAMNDFGASLGGPLSIPKLYSGKNRTFFFMDFEGLRLPQSTTQVLSIPTAAIKSGDLSPYLPKTAVRDPTSGSPFPGNIIPYSRISPFALAVQNFGYNLTPNFGSPGAISNNYVQNYPTTITNNQGDLRLDQNVSPNQAVFARFTYKRREYLTAPTGTPVQGGGSAIENDYNLTGAWNYIITPRLVNELRVGLSGQDTGTGYGYSAASVASQLGLVLPEAPPAGSASPTFAITGFTPIQAGSTAWSRSTVVEVIDNLTRTVGHHSIKFGAEIRSNSGVFANVFAQQRMGLYTFNNSPSTSSSIGSPYASFLLGVPDYTTMTTVLKPNAYDTVFSYGFYALDDFKLTQRLTINYGLRYEWHPEPNEKYGNIGNLLPDYRGLVNGVPVRGAFVYPDGAQSLIDPILAQSVYPMPFFTASQAGLPNSLRFASKNDFAPRIGLAWRATRDGKLVIRGGYGGFIEGLAGTGISALWSVPGSWFGQYNNVITNGKPLYSFPYPFPSNLALPGTFALLGGIDTHYKDAYIQQWNLTIERELGFSTGLRISYEGSHTSNLSVRYNPNQVPANTVGYSNLPADARPYPLLTFIRDKESAGRANYGALTVAVTRRLSHGLQFQPSYVFAKNLANGAGSNPTAFEAEVGLDITNAYNPNLDYGNVAFTRRQRFQMTFLYSPEAHFGNKALNFAANNWEVAGVTLVEAGPFLTITAGGADPAGVGPLVNGYTRSDIVPGVPLYPTNQGPHGWINPAAFAIPANNIGRFGDSPVGAAVGPGTAAVSLSVFRSFRITEGARFRLGASAANVFNHPNYAVPNLTLGVANFGTITNMQTAEAGGPRSLQLTARIIF